MITRREMRRRARGMVGPALGVALTGYFASHLVEGDRGLLAWVRLTREIHAQNDRLADLRAQSTDLRAKVADMTPDHLDPDLLDERVRAALNLAAPGEIVIMQSPPK
jgi:cell division protein FtsB